MVGCSSSAGANRGADRTRGGTVVSSGSGDDSAHALDRAVNRLFGSGVLIADLLHDPGLDPEIATRLRAVAEGLDAAVHEIQSWALTRTRDEHGARPRPRHATERTLRRINIDEVFAYALRGNDFYRVTDDRLWAHDSDGLLLSARSGTPLAQRHGRIYYDTTTDVPLFYEPASKQPRN
jgi:hypothetical protein